MNVKQRIIVGVLVLMLALASVGVVGAASPIDTEWHGPNTSCTGC
jgi:hypothetical protein